MKCRAKKQKGDLNMKYRNLAQTGLMVSQVCLGTMTFGDQLAERDAVEAVIGRDGLNPVHDVVGQVVLAGCLQALE